MNKKSEQEFFELITDHYYPPVIKKSSRKTLESRRILSNKLFKVGDLIEIKCETCRPLWVKAIIIKDFSDSTIYGDEIYPTCVIKINQPGHKRHKYVICGRAESMRLLKRSA